MVNILLLFKNDRSNLFLGRTIVDQALLSFSFTSKDYKACAIIDQKTIGVSTKVGCTNLGNLLLLHCVIRVKSEGIEFMLPLNVGFPGTLD